MRKTIMKTPLVEIDGDEMTRVIWRMIKDTLILPFIDLKTEYYDLGLENRIATDDKVTIKSAEAAKSLGVAVKCATITPNKQRMEEYKNMKRLFPSPNATIRASLDGTVFRTPIALSRIEPAVRSWVSPITIARHAYGDIYVGIEHHTDDDIAGSMLLISKTDDTETFLPAQTIEGGSVWQIMHNSDRSIRSFAKSCMSYAISVRQDLWFSAKDTISKIYDGRFRDIFEEEYLAVKSEFEKLGISYFYTLIDDAAARIMHSPGGFVWALKNYDGDVMSDLMSSAFGSVAMMTSVLVSPDGVYEYEAAHGTVTRHYRRYLKGEETSTNPVATILAWTGALRRRAEIDSLPELAGLTDSIDKALFETLNEGTVTNDLAGLYTDSGPLNRVTTQEFLNAVSGKL